MRSLLPKSPTGITADPKNRPVARLYVAGAADRQQGKFVDGAAMTEKLRRAMLAPRKRIYSLLEPDAAAATST